MSGKLTEKQIQEQAISLLRACGCWCWLTHKVGAFRHRNVRKGVSDILGIWPPRSGRLLAVEVKAGKGRLTPEQEAFLREVRDQGGMGIVVRSVDEVVQELGLPVRM